MPARLKWPAMPTGETVEWDGAMFWTESGSTRILSCSFDPSGWDHQLTDLHEIEAGPGTHPIDQASRRNAVGMLRSAGLDPKGAILEVGCSSGFFLRDLRAAFPEAEVVGSDAVRATLEKVSESAQGLPLVLMDILDCPLAGGQFDAVVALNVLEHLEDDALALSEISRLVKPGGVVVVEVPQGPGLFDVYDVLLKHVRRYSRAGLLGKILGAGLTVERTTSIGFLPYLPFFVAKKVARLRYGVRGQKAGDREALVRGKIRRTSRNGLLDVAFAAEARLPSVGERLPGIRLVAVARKPVA